MEKQYTEKHLWDDNIAKDYKSDLIRLGYENFVQQVATYKSMSGSLEGLYYELIEKKRNYTIRKP